MGDIGLVIPAAEMERLRARYERERERKLRYEQKTGPRNRNPNRPKHSEYEFVMWDGEAPKDTSYSLFGSSLGHEICHPFLETEECFDLLLEAKAENPYTIFFWFGGRYDWDEIIRKSMPTRILARLKRAGSVYWKGYRLTETPGKIYTIGKDGVNVTLYEVHGWFHSDYVTALRNYQIGSKKLVDEIEEGKENRAEFLWSEIGEIREYMRKELQLGPLLMERIRDICFTAGFNPRAWYGPSALARELLTRNKIFNSMAETPEAVNRAACFGFAGGRFEPFRGGIVERNYTYDKNSAYMDAALDLPNLAKGTWRHTNGVYESGKFGIYRIRYHHRVQSRDDLITPQPLFRRLKSGMVCWPFRVEGWYWGPEAETVADNSDATFLEAWIFDENNPSDRPFQFVRDMYRQRLVLQGLADDNPSKVAEIAFKWALASIYGQAARRVGWDKRRRKPPITHQIEWAGYITSHCRAAMYKAALKCGSSLITIDTDSVTSLTPIDVPEGKQLGEWKSAIADDGVFFQNGIYFTKKDGKWSKGKIRGVERRAKTPSLTVEMLIEAITEGHDIQLRPTRKYITVRQALAGRFTEMGDWKEHEGNILTFGGSGKRYHNPMMCGKYCDGTLHAFLPRVMADDIFNIQSIPHKLPWKEAEDTALKDEYVDTFWVNDDDVDHEEWLAVPIKRYNDGISNQG